MNENQLKFNIETIDLNQNKQDSCRFMICEMDSVNYTWLSKFDLNWLVCDDRILNKVFEFLKIAKHNSVDLIIFPELSIPDRLIEKLQSWSKEQETIFVGYLVGKNIF